MMIVKGDMMTAVSCNYGYAPKEPSLIVTVANLNDGYGFKSRIKQLAYLKCNRTRTQKFELDSRH